MGYTNSKTNWTPDNSVTYDDLNRIEGNIDALSRIQTPTGTGTAIVLQLGTLVPNYTVDFIAQASNGGNATWINGIPLYKPASNNPPTLVAGNAYTIWYNANSNCFFTKASAQGSALASDVRKNTTFSNDYAVGIPGGLDLSALISGNLKAGITIDGVTGKSTVVDTEAGDILAEHVLAGKRAFARGLEIIGTLTLASIGGVQMKVGTVTSNSSAVITVSEIPFTPQFGFFFYIEGNSGATNAALLYEANTHYMTTPGYNMAELYGWDDSGSEENWASSRDPNQTATFSNGTFTYTGAYPSTSGKPQYTNKTYFYCFVG